MLLLLRHPEQAQARQRGRGHGAELLLLPLRRRRLGSGPRPPRRRICRHRRFHLRQGQGLCPQRHGLPQARGRERCGRPRCSGQRHGGGGGQGEGATRGLLLLLFCFSSSETLESSGAARGRRRGFSDDLASVPPYPLFQVATGSSRSIAAATVDLAFSGEVKGAAASPPPPSLSFLSRSSDASTSALVSKLCPSGET